MSKIFISYAREDHEIATRLYEDLKQIGSDPWLDREDLLPGEEWEDRISQVIRECSHVVALISRHSVSKRGFVQKELRQALKMLDELPPRQIFILPCRLDDSEPSHEQLARLHRVDLFPSYEEGLKRVALALGFEPALPTEKRESVPARSRRWRQPAEMPDDVGELIQRKAELDFPSDFSTRRFQIQREVAAWQKLQRFEPPGVPERVRSLILSRASVDFPDDFSTRLFQVEREVASWRKLQELHIPGVPSVQLRTILQRAEADFPEDFSTRLFQVQREAEAWLDLYGE